MKATVDTIWTTITEFPPRPWDKKLRKHFTKKSPDAFWKQRNSPAAWNGATTFISPKTDRFPTGLLHELQSWCDSEGITLEIDDKRTFPEPKTTQITEDYLKGITLRDYQLDAIHEALLRQRCCLKLSTGSGKCVTLDTIVEVEGMGEVPIGTFFGGMEAGDVAEVDEELKVKTLVGNQQVSHLYLSEPREILSVNNGRLKGVEEHRVLLKDGKYKMLKDLEKGDEIVLEIDSPSVQYFMAALGLTDPLDLLGKDLEVPDELLPEFEKYFHLTRY